MTRFIVQLLPQAETEFEQAFHWYFERSPLAATSFREEVFRKVDALSVDAEMWPLDEDGIHRCGLDRFPYTLHYDLEGTLVTILAIAHQRRRPGYWTKRASQDG